MLRTSETRNVLMIAAVLGAAACTKDGGPFLAPVEPLAYTRFISAVPDTFATDWRFVDAIANSPTAILQPFRGFTPYQATSPGQRRLRIFPNPGGTFVPIGVVTQVMIDTLLTFAENKYYTIIHVGFARTGSTPADRVIVLEDAIPENIGTQIAVRTVNLGVGLGSLDVYAAASTTAPLPASAAFTNVAFGAQSAYTMMAPGTLALRVTAAGTNTPVLANAAAPAGAVADLPNLLQTIGGAAQPGSAFTAFIFPRSTAGTTAPQTTAFQNSAIIYLIDRHPK
jgi:hypothetical protein